MVWAMRAKLSAHHLLLPLVLAGLGACATTPPPTSVVAPSETETPSASASEGAPDDLDFNCTVPEGALQPWTPEGVAIPVEVSESFGYWMGMDGSEVPEALNEACTDPPSGGDYSPVKPADKGGVSRADIVVATQPVRVYRAYSSGTFECGTDKPAAEFGSWWSPVELASPKAGYAASNAICPAWNDLSMVLSCTLAVGTVVLIGPTQSVECSGTASCSPPPEGWDAPLPATESPQLYINSYGRSDAELESFLLDCRIEPWEE